MKLRKALAVTAAAGAAALGLATVAAVPAVAATSCSAAYSVQTDWGSGFTAQLLVTNTGTTPITGWTVTYSYAGNQTLANGWSGNWSQSGKNVTVTNAAWNGNLAVGANSGTVGANFGYSGSNVAPTSVSCAPAGGVTTQPTINATPTTLSVAQGHTGTFTLALSAAPSANETVTVAAAGNTGLTASPTSLTFTPANFATPQTVTVTADTTGTGTTTFTASGSGYTSATVSATELPIATPSITATPTSLSVVQGSTGTFTVALSAAPSANETVTVAASGNTGVTASPSTLTFTPANFATPQTVTATANTTGSGTTTFTIAGSGYTSATVSVMETVKITPTIVATPTSVTVMQGNTGTFTLALSAAPSANETVTVAATGNTGLTASPTSLTFTPANFASPQTVTLTANSSSTGTTTFTASGTGYTSATVTGTETPVVTTGAAPQLHVSGNKLVDAAGNTVLLHGVNRSGTEYSCVQGNGIFDGPNDQASLTAMKTWGPVNAVRVPLNEACWNAESYVNSSFAGTNYINAIKAYVSLLNSNGMVAILDLHWTDGSYTGNSAGNCTSAQVAEAFCQKPMPDAAQAIPFWTSVANTFKGNDAVIFDLFNEPFASRADNNNTTEGWQCWQTGSPCTGISYPVAGMQQMVNAVRSTGANNVLMLGGEEFSNDLADWMQFKPTDPDNNLAVSWHSYNFNACLQSCWTSTVAPVAAQVPIVAGEIGENDCAGGYITPLTTFAESNGISFLGWAWNADFACSSGPGLITDYTGTPTAFGAAYKAILQALPA